MQSKERHREYELQRYHALRTKAIAILGGKCKVCGSMDNLQFDHINPEEKAFNISKIWSLSESLFLAELAECQLLCENHHKEKHSKREHGTYNMYKRGKCRCTQCKLANSLYMRKYRRKYGRFEQDK